MDALYAEAIRRHHRAPRNVGALAVPPARSGAGDNPLCGDRVTVFVEVVDERVARATFEGAGCAISQAIASLLTEALVGLAVGEAEALLGRARAALTGEVDDDAARATLGELGAIAGIAAFPARHRCASLALEAAQAALFPR